MEELRLDEMNVEEATETTVEAVKEGGIGLLGGTLIAAACVVVGFGVYKFVKKRRSKKQEVVDAEHYEEEDLGPVEETE